MAIVDCFSCLPEKSSFKSKSPSESLIERKEVDKTLTKFKYICIIYNFFLEWYIVWINNLIFAEFCEKPNWKLEPWRLDVELRKRPTDHCWGLVECCDLVTVRQMSPVLGKVCCETRFTKSVIPGYSSILRIYIDKGDAASKGTYPNNAFSWLETKKYTCNEIIIRNKFSFFPRNKIPKTKPKNPA